MLISLLPNTHKVLGPIPSTRKKKIPKGKTKQINKKSQTNYPHTFPKRNFFSITNATFFIIISLSMWLTLKISFSLTIWKGALWEELGYGEFICLHVPILWLCD